MHLSLVSFQGHAVTRKRDMVSGSENFVETLHNLAEGVEL